ncbi:MAG: hypothetical protein HS116_24125 [Planctomycetes bacterium]|nr:hypothetical protein [Planctomycetota bacterium]
MRAPLKLACVLLGLAILVAPAGALEQIWEDPAAAATGQLTVEQIEQALRELSSDEYARRAQASDRLRTHADPRVLARLYDALESDLSPETRMAVSSLLPTVRSAVGEKVMVKDFLILGPYPFPDGMQPRDHQETRDWLDLATGVPSEGTLDPEAKLPLDPAKPKGKQLEWQRPYAGLQGSVDFTTLFKQRPEFANAFALTYVYSERPQSVRLWMGSDDGIAVWVSGTNVIWKDVQRGMSLDQDRAEAQLQAGWNPVLIRISQGWGGWALALRITDRRGRPWPAKLIDPLCGGQPRPAVPAPKKPPVEAAEPAPADK